MDKKLLRFKTKGFNRIKGCYEKIEIDNNFKMQPTATDIKHWRPNISDITELSGVKAPIDPSCYMFADGVDNGLRNYIARDPASDIVDLMNLQKKLENEKDDITEDYKNKIEETSKAVEEVINKARNSKIQKVDNNTEK